MARFPNVCMLTAVALLSTPISSAKSQSRADWRATEKKSQTQAPQKHTAQYDGVTPGSGNNLPRVEELKNKPGSWVTWPGFRARYDGASQIFLQTTGPIQYTVSETKKKIIFKLENTKVHLSNNRNPLVTTHFNTPLKRAYLKKRKKHLELILELKQECTFQLSQNTDADGYFYLFIDFPPGKYPIIESESPRPTFEGIGAPDDQQDPQS